MTKKIVNDIAFRTIGCAIEVHKQLGPGLLESVYQECMMEELTYQGLAFRSLDPITLHYRGKPLRTKLVPDLIVEKSLSSN